MRQLQVSRNTYVFRETMLARSARARLGARDPSQLRILSFGCSIGDELVTLRAVFPEARIVGCDISPVSLEVAARSVGHLAEVVVSDRERLAEHAPFDLVFACSVLCLNPAPKDFADSFPPARFDRLLRLLDGLLRPGGILAITNASYRFRDSRVAAGYDPVRADVLGSSGFINLYHRDGRLMLQQCSAPSAHYYRMRPALRIAEDEELAECLFQTREAGAPAVHVLRLAPPPEGFEPLFCYERRNVDGVESCPADALVITTRIRFGHDPISGRAGIATQQRWKSLVHDGEHLRPETWRIVPELDGLHAGDGPAASA